MCYLLVDLLISLTVLFLFPISDEELNLKAIFNSTEATKWSHDYMDTQYEWLFINITTTERIFDYFDINQSMIVYTVCICGYSGNYFPPVRVTLKEVHVLLIWVLE